MKRVTHTLTYPGTTLDDVFAMLGDPGYRKAVADHEHVQDFSCDVTPDGAGMTVRLEQAYGTDRIPSFAQRLVGDEIRFVQVETWPSSASADIDVRIPGKPGEMTGTATLTQRGGDVVEQIDLSVRVGIPLIGGRAESLVADFVRQGYDAEHKVGVKWLRGEWRA